VFESVKPIQLPMCFWFVAVVLIDEIIVHLCVSKFNW